MRQRCGFILSNTLSTTSSPWNLLSDHKTSRRPLQLCPPKSSGAAGNIVQRFPASIQMKIAWPKYLISLKYFTKYSEFLGKTSHMLSLSTHYGEERREELILAFWVILNKCLKNPLTLSSLQRRAQPSPSSFGWRRNQIPAATSQQRVHVYILTTRCLKAKPSSLEDVSTWQASQEEIMLWHKVKPFLLSLKSSSPPFENDSFVMSKYFAYPLMTQWQKEATNSVMLSDKSEWYSSRQLPHTFENCRS